MRTGRLVRAIYGHKTTGDNGVLQECGCEDSTPPNVTSVTVIDPDKTVPSEESLQAGLFPGMSANATTLGSDSGVSTSTPEVVSGLASMTTDLVSAEIPTDARDEDVRDKLVNASALLESVLKYLKVR